MAIILGIDPGSRITGFGVINENGQKCEYIASGCIRTPEGNLPDKLQTIFQGVQEVIDMYHPTTMGIEQVFMAKSADSALKLGQARGSAIVAAAMKDVEIAEYSARQVKKTVTGSGAADKEQVMLMVMYLLKLDKRPQVDASDALAIALCHMQHRQTLIPLGLETAKRRRGRLRLPS